MIWTRSELFDMLIQFCLFLLKCKFFLDHAIYTVHHHWVTLPSIDHLSTPFLSKVPSLTLYTSSNGKFFLNRVTVTSGVVPIEQEVLTTGMGNDLPDTSWWFEDLWLNKIDDLLYSFMSERDREGEWDRGKAWRPLSFCFLNSTSLPPRRKCISKCSARPCGVLPEWKTATQGMFFIFYFLEIVQETVASMEYAVCI